MAESQDYFEDPRNFAKLSAEQVEEIERAMKPGVRQSQNLRIEALRAASRVVAAMIQRREVERVPLDENFSRVALQLAEQFLRWLEGER